MSAHNFLDAVISMGSLVAIVLKIHEIEYPIEQEAPSRTNPGELVSSRMAHLDEAIREDLGRLECFIRDIFAKSPRVGAKMMPNVWKKLKSDYNKMFPGAPINQVLNPNIFLKQKVILWLANLEKNSH